MYNVAGGVIERLLHLTIFDYLAHRLGLQRPPVCNAIDLSMCFVRILGIYKRTDWLTIEGRLKKDVLETFS